METLCVLSVIVKIGSDYKLITYCMLLYRLVKSCCDFSKTPNDMQGSNSDMCNNLGSYGKESSQLDLTMCGSKNIN